MKRTLKYFPGCTTDLEWMRDFQESVRHYYNERLKGKVMVKRQWEYKRAWFSANDFATTMNGYGKEGWECMHVDEQEGLCYVYLKRPVELEKQLLNE